MCANVKNFFKTKAIFLHFCFDILDFLGNFVELFGLTLQLILQSLAHTACCQGQKQIDQGTGPHKQHCTQLQREVAHFQLVGEIGIAHAEKENAQDT